MASRPDTRQLRLHVQQSLNSLDVFIVTPDRFAAALASHPGLAGRFDVSFGADRAELDRALATAEILLAGNFETDDLDARAPALRWIHSIFAGVEKLAPSVPARMTLTNSSGVHSAKAGEFGIGAIISLNGALPQLLASQRRRAWQPRFTPGLAGKTAAMVGTGKLVADLARHCRHFGLRVVGINRSGPPVSGFDRVVRVEAMDAVLPETDFLIVTLPNTAATRRLVGERVLSALPQGAGLVSIGRGTAVDEAALIGALRGPSVRRGVGRVRAGAPASRLAAMGNGERGDHTALRR